MTNLIRSLLKPAEERSSLSLDEWVSYFKYGGNTYPFMLNQTLQGDREEIEQNFSGYVEGIYKRNGVVFACMLVRQLLFSEARFQFRQVRSSGPGNLFGTKDLAILEKPWPNGTTGDLLTRVIQDADLAGNAFFARRRDGLQRLRPDWVTIILGSPGGPGGVQAAPVGDLDARAVGYAYTPGGIGSGKEAVTLDIDEVVHFAPTPDPLYSFRGMSWLTPVIREIMSDSAATTHKLKFFENGATPNLVVKLDIKSPDKFNEWIEVFEKGHKGVEQAYKTLYLAGGADVTPVGTDFKQLDFKVVQGAGESRVAAAAGVPPIIVGLSEGLAASTYSNYAQARRRFADGTMRPLWRNVAASFAKIIAVPENAELWYDDRDISFLQEDQKDAADIKQVQAASIRALVDAGFTPESVIDAVTSGDLTRLVHTGLYSVQLQPPNPSAPSPAYQAGRALAALVAKQLAGTED